MANTQIVAESALRNFPSQTTPPPAVVRVLSRFDRSQIEGFVEVSIALMDFADGDPDIEPNGDEAEPCGDEQDGQPQAEDEFVQLGFDGGAGCPVSDPGGCEHDGREPVLGH